MTHDLVIGIDAGTSVIKAVAFDLEGRQIAVTSTPNRVNLGSDSAAEQDLTGTWNDTATTLRALAERVPSLASRTAVIAATGQGDGTWLIDADGEPVGPAMLWLDGRAAAQVAALRNSAAARGLADRTGTALNPSMQGVQLLWLREHQPARLERARTAMHCKDWLFFKATGVRSTCDAEAVFTFGNFRTGAYDDEVLTLLGLNDLKQLLAPVGVPGQLQAPLTAAAARDTGLRSGTPVVLSPMDVPATLLGGGGVAYGPSGLLHVGCSILGSTGMHGWCTQGLDAIVPSAEAGYTMMMPVPDVRARLMSHMAATLNIDWLMALIGDAAQLTSATLLSKHDMLARLNDMVLSAAPAQAIYHPYIADSGERGPFVDPQARAQLSGFSSQLGLAGMARAVFEGIALASRDCYAALGPLPDEIRLTGGAARSPALRQLLANVTARPVRVSHRDECGAAGAAMIAVIAHGHYASVREALPVWVDAYLDDRTTVPDAQQTALYDGLFPIYRQLASSSRAPWADLARLRRTSLPFKDALS